MIFGVGCQLQNLLKEFHPFILFFIILRTREKLKQDAHQKYSRPELEDELSILFQALNFSRGECLYLPLTPNQQFLRFRQAFFYLARHCLTHDKHFVDPWALSRPLHVRSSSFMESWSYYCSRPMGTCGLLKPTCKPIIYQAGQSILYSQSHTE